MVEALHDLSKKLVRIMCSSCTTIYISLNCFDTVLFQIKWDDRLDGTPNTVYYISVDGTDCPIQEPIPFDRRWWTKKFNAAGVRYEVGVALRKSAIVHINGPFACGANPDRKIFAFKLKHKLHLAHERCFTDKGYWGHADVCTYIDPQGLVNGQNSPRMRKTVAAIQARHETVFKRMKQFRVLGTKFRHDLAHHQHCFRAVAGLVQLNMKSDEPLFHYSSWLNKRMGNVNCQL